MIICIVYVCVLFCCVICQFNCDWIGLNSLFCVILSVFVSGKIVLDDDDDDDCIAMDFFFC